MSDDQSKEATSVDENQQDPIKQIKSEFGRKQENVMNELNALRSQLSQIADTVITAASAKNKQSEEIDVDPIVDPKGYKESLKKELRKEMEQSLGAERERGTVLSTLVANYPELQQSNSELTKTALQIYNNLSPAERSSPSGYKIAVMQAAQEVGILPMSKRKQSSSEDSDFTMSASNSSVRTRPSQKAKEKELDEKTLAFAELIGRPVNDPKYQESLKKTVSGRKRSWQKFE